jgi:O-antigen/teichoic acid export membrane protein
MLKHVGAVIVLLFISPSILAFFIWHALVALLKAFLLAKWLWKLLPKTGIKSKFDKYLLVKNWKFTSGILSISLVTMILLQVDKIVLSKMLTLEIFGYYMLALNLTNAVHGLRSPILTALFPRYTQLATSSEESVLIRLYHKGCQYLSTLIIPLAIVIACFSKVILMAWLGDTVVVQNTHQILTLLIIGAGINAVVVPPYMLQLAHGWTKLLFFTNVVALICIIPLTVWLAYLYQGVGAAWAWLILNLGYFVFHVPIMHRKILKTEMWNWYLTDIMFPVLIASTIGYVSYMIMPIDLPVYLGFTWAVITYLISMISIGLSFPIIRKEFLHYRGLAFEKIGRIW